MKVSIVGCGNMGAAIASGVAANKDIRIGVYDRHPEKLEQLKSYPNISVLLSELETINFSDYLILCVRVPQYAEFLQKFRRNLQNKTLISIAGHLKIEAIQKQLSESTAVIRVLPNIAIKIRQSLNLVAHSVSTSDKQLADVLHIFEITGTNKQISEQQFDNATILSSCQPAFFANYLRGAQLAGIQMGLSAQDALEISAACGVGACSLVANEGNCEIVQNQVTTPGGMTIRGITELEQQGFCGIVCSSLLKIADLH